MWDRTLWEMALCLNPALPQASPFYPKRLKLFTEIYIGHTPTINYGQTAPMLAGNVWNVDTGAAFTGPLSAVEAGTGRVIQSDPVQRLYPFERGRNS
jgi:serine/threonine protein phosphatase 1